MGEETLAERVVALCSKAEQVLPAPEAATVAAARRALVEPLRIAFVGRVSSGKSTLVNAYLGRRLAPTDEGECTRVVTTIRFGPVDRARVLLRDGTSLALDFEGDGRLPSKFGVEPDDVAGVEVELSLDVLRSAVMVDTPGLNSAHEENSERTERLLGIDEASRSHAASADVILFVLNATAKDDEREVLRLFRSVSLGLHAAPATAVGVLAKADEVSGDADPRELATKLAAAHARRLGREVATVVPVIGLLAETAETRFGEADAVALRRLASLGPDAREEMLLGSSYFLGLESDVPADQRARLYEMLRPFGLRRLLDAADHGASAPQMIKALLDCSGLASLQEEVRRRFHARAAVLKSARALGAIVAAAASPAVGYPARRLLAGSVDDLRTDPAMHALEELRALSLVCSDESLLPGEQAAEAIRVLSDPEERIRPGPESAAVAARSVARWTGIANTALEPRARDVARVVARSLDIAREQSGSR